MTQRNRWNPIAAVMYGVPFGAFAGGLMVWATDRGDRWQHQADTILAIMMMTTLACVAVFYLRNFFSQTEIKKVWPGLRPTILEQLQILNYLVEAVHRHSPLPLHVIQSKTINLKRHSI
jgi:hypothetical protein